jgi:hypothetical protein
MALLSVGNSKKRVLNAVIERTLLNGIQINIFEKNERGAIAIARPLTLEVVDTQSPVCHPPTIQVGYNDEQFLQSIVDQAWDMGIRPRYARETTPEINAIKYHLEDVRRLAFKRVK